MLPILTSADNGLMVFDTNSNFFFYWRDDEWVAGLGILNLLNAGGDLTGIYPNPSEEVITISADAIFSGQVQLIDIDGKVIWSGHFETSNSQSVDLSNYANGVYMLRIETPDGMVRKRVVKK